MITDAKVIYYIGTAIRANGDLLITGKAVEDESKANAKLVKSLVPAFRPSFTKLQNGTRLYNLIPDSIELVKYGEEKKDKTTGGETTGGGSGTEAGGTGSDNGDGLE